MLDHLLIWVNGRRHELRGYDAFLSLSDYLRRTQGLIGTKIVCSEGDCGACTVLIGRPAADGTGFVYRPVDACIQFMFQLEGTHIVTVEGLGGETNPSAVQQAMIECHGSQCGFCTPGFVVAMTGLLEERDELDEPSLRCGLIGNLCRCTGYTPIIEAGTKVTAASHPRLEKLYPAEAMLSQCHPRRHQHIELTADSDTGPHICFCPADLDEALSLLANHPQATIIAGATDVGVRINKSSAVPATILDLNRITELDGIAVEDDELVCGARASWTALEEMCEQLIPEFHKIIALFGAP
ncbi:MAG: 2Fe-2S iron-sulfur cluster-binding protein, partial [Pirellulales bacterium]